MLKTMSKFALALSMLVALVAVAPAAQAKPQIGKSAPAFSGQTADGKSLDLKMFAGKTVVLEWTNKDCPYVRKHYGTQNMQNLQQEAKSKFGVVWISVISSAPDTQGYVEGPEALANVKATGAKPDHVILDPDGIIGLAYGAQTTPHMYIIDGTSMLRFMGGIDDKPSSNWETVKGANNHVQAALSDLAAGRPVSQPATRPYGCSVKYRGS